MYWPERMARRAASSISGLTKHFDNGILLMIFLFVRDWSLSVDKISDFDQVWYAEQFNESGSTFPTEHKNTVVTIFLLVWLAKTRYFLWSGAWQGLTRQLSTRIHTSSQILEKPCSSPFHFGRRHVAELAHN
jgi:hypothetical protein